MVVEIKFVVERNEIVLFFNEECNLKKDKKIYKNRIHTFTY